MVTGDATLEVNGLFERVMADPVVLAERILQQVLNQLAQECAVGTNADEPPEDVLAIALGDRLAQMIIPQNGSISQEWSGSAISRNGPDAHEGSEPHTQHEELIRCEELLDRQTVLAAALGACDCWGQQPECPICHGAGGSGWALPDRQLFASYVQPAVRVMDNEKSGPPSAQWRTEHQRKER
jgi:hypothetical protein